VGPLFRERFWLVTALPAAIVAAALAFGSRPSPGAPTWPWPLTAALIGAGAALAARLGEPEVAPDGARLRFVSYNIQQGFSESGIDDIDAQLAVLMELDPDVVALQECDTARLAGANEDVVRYLARRLGMRAVYGPGPAAGTFGVTLLSRYPIEGARTIYLESEGEQTAAVIATLRVGRERHQVVATHLGNDGPAVQLDNVLAAVRDAPSVVLLGDFNFVAGAPQYRATTARLDDAWERAARRASERGPGDIDHAFVSRSLRVRAAGYQRSAASDHPALWIELE
jgi:endonuclease/exonuclease/phosphatase family metal-dependent hydrolase